MPRLLLLLLLSLMSSGIPPLAVAATGASSEGFLSLTLDSFDSLATAVTVDTTSAVIAGAAVVLGISLIAGFFLPAVIDAIAFARLSGRLRRLIKNQSKGGEIAPADLRTALDKTPLATVGSSYVDSLWRQHQLEDASAASWRSTVDPEPLLRPLQRQRNAVGALTTQLCLALAGLGVVVAVHDMLSSGAGSSAIAAAVGLLAAFDNPLAGAPLVLGLGFFFAARLLTQSWLYQTSKIAVSLRVLFPPAATEFLAQQLAETVNRSKGEKFEAIAAVDAGLSRLADELKAMLSGHDRRIAASVASSVQRVIQPVAKSMQDTLSRIEIEDGAAAQRLLQGVLDQFIGEFQQRFGAHMVALGDVIANARTLADDLQQSFKQSEAQLRSDAAVLAQRLTDGVAEATTSASARQTDAVQAILEHTDHTIADAAASIERLVSRTDATIDTWTERLGEVTGDLLARGADELRRTTAAFNQLHTILETLSISILPAVNRLITTQERLHAVLAADQDRTQSMSAAASDLGEAVRYAREMVERQMLLTRDLAQIAHRGAGDAPLGSNPQPASGRLAQAIEDLRAEAEKERGSLPQL